MSARRPAHVDPAPLVRGRWVAVAVLSTVCVASASAAERSVVSLGSRGTELFLSYQRHAVRPVRFDQLVLTVKAGTVESAIDQYRIPGIAGRSYRERPRVRLVDVNGDNTPDAVVTVRTARDRHPVSSIAVSTSTTSWDGPKTVDWGRPGFRLVRDSGQHGSVFVTRDSRFDVLGPGERSSTLPLIVKAGGTVEQIDRHGRIVVDVSAEFPDRLRRDADRHRGAYSLQAQGGPGALESVGQRHAAMRAATAAIVADLVRVGDTAGARAAVQIATDDHALSTRSRARLGRLLSEWGYLKDPADVGLSRPAADAAKRHARRG